MSHPHRGVARQLSGLGLFRYDGQVGNLRAPWMGNWNYLRAHPLFAGIPADMVAPLQHRFLENAVRWLASAG